LAARILADHFDDVLILDRDEPGDTAEARKGVPQGRHAHCLLAGGGGAIGEIFPGIFESLAAAGARPTDMAGDVAWFNAGTWRLQYPSGIEIYVQSRPLLEREIRRRVSAIPRITQRFGINVTGLAFDSAGANVTGVHIGDDGETIEAHLVLDCMGRGTKTPDWLQKAGFAPPPTTKITVDVGYGTQLFRSQTNRDWPWHTLLVQTQPPTGTRYGCIFRIENDVLQVTLVGQFGDYPPNDAAGFLRFAESLDHPALFEALREAEPIGPVHVFRFPANSWRHYEKIERFPGRFLVLGDAMCSVNPLYGQGMTTAALEALALRQALNEAADDTALARCFFRRASKIAALAWMLAAGADLSYPQAIGERPLGHGFLLWYIGQVLALASHDPLVLQHWIRVTNMQKPIEHLMAPPVALRVLKRVAFGGRALPVEQPLRALAQFQ
jgi:2-polyprenyl-6-methoxyphenol hydroxylase-like FAD-dependent oxidoreductase